MLTGSFTLPGAGHGVIGCQDYAMANVCDGVAIAVLSDGCSTAPHTELGAAMLCHAFFARLRGLVIESDGQAQADLLRCFLPPEEAEVTPGGVAPEQRLTSKIHSFGLQLIGSVSAAHNLLTGENYDVPMPLHATSSFVLCNGRQAIAAIYGDGSLIIHEGGDDIRLTSVDFNENAPYYLVYERNAGVLGNYVSGVGSYGRTVSVRCDGPTLLPSGRAAAAPVGLPTVVVIPDVSGIQSISITSDGIDTLSDHEGRAISPVDVSRKLVKFPLKTDGFALRQRNILSRAIASKKLSNHDDLSMATVLLAGNGANA